MTDTEQDAFLFDGRSAVGRQVQARVSEGRLLVSAPDGTPLCDASVAALDLSEPFAAAPRMLTLPDGATLEVPDSAAFSAALGAAGRPPGLVARLQQSWPATVAALLLLAGALGVGYVHALPAAADALARGIPPPLEQRLGQGVLSTLDAGVFQPSRLSEAQREALARSFAELAARAAPGAPVRLLHRRASGDFALNAFALPGGIVVLLDGIPEAVAGESVATAVLAHELCHVGSHDPTRALLQAFGVVAGAGLIWGDISSQAANGPALLLSFGYSRELEAAADACAVQRLREVGRPPRALYGALTLLQARERGSGVGGVPRFLSTHPPMAERLAALRREPDIGEPRFGVVYTRTALGRARLPPPPAPPSDEADELWRQVHELGGRIARERDPERKAALRETFRELRERALQAREAVDESTPGPLRVLPAGFLEVAAELGEERDLAAVFVDGSPPDADVEDLTAEAVREMRSRQR